jgi:hypothetical protein
MMYSFGLAVGTFLTSPLGALTVAVPLVRWLITFPLVSLVLVVVGVVDSITFTVLDDRLRSIYFIGIFFVYSRVVLPPQSSLVCA